MNPFLLPPSERLNHWKIFRRALPNMLDAHQLKAVVEYFSKTPLMTISYNVDAPATWPTIWEMINAGDWCRNSTAIGMHATLRLVGWAADRIDLRYVMNHKDSSMVLVVLVDAKLLLNYDWGSLAVMPTGLRTLRKYQCDKRGYYNFGGEPKGTL